MQSFTRFKLILWSFTNGINPYFTKHLRKSVCSRKTYPRLFGAELSELKSELYDSEKEKLLNLILSKVVNPALENPNVSDEVKTSVQDTKKRLELQDSAQGIIYFFQDSLNSLRGQEIKKEFHKNNLLAFEDIKDEVEDLYFR